MTKNRPLHQFQVLYPSELKEGYSYVKIYSGFEVPFVLLQHKAMTQKDKGFGTHPDRWMVIQWKGNWSWVESASYADCGLLPYNGGRWNLNNWIKDTYKAVCCQGIASLQEINL